MSFQGDVRGIGLAELLQGLSRGRKEGVLTLSARGGARCVLGVEGGSVYLLPEPEEDPELWRDRLRNALADDPSFQMDPARLSSIARAARLDNLYDLLDGEGVHFRFEPVSIPGRTGPDDTGAVYCAGIPIEYLLLEYARINDELGGAGDLSWLADDSVPALVDPSLAPEPANRQVYETCDGLSTVAETADRLGWTRRQTRLALLGELNGRRMGLAQPEQVLQLALRELSRSNLQRAAARLAHWIREGRPGPLPIELADALESEWLAGRLSGTLVLLGPRQVRTLLRRLDRGLGGRTRGYWQEAERIHPWDVLARMRRLTCEFRDDEQDGRPELRELLDLARSMREGEHPWRSGPVLVMAAHLQPEAPLLQIELGQGLLNAGRVPEGTPWILTGAAALLDKDEADRAIIPLRALYEKDPHNRECRQLLARAKRSTTQVKRLRKNLIIGLAISGALATAATVQVRREQQRRDQLQYVQGLLGTPKQALAELDRLFPGDESTEIRELRADLRERERLDEVAQRNAWLKSYNDASAECTSNDPVLGLSMALELATPPRLTLLQEPWPLRQDLYRGLVTTLEKRIAALGEPDFEDPEQRTGEGRIERQIEQLTNLLVERGKPSVELAELSVQLSRLDDLLHRREEVRQQQERQREIDQQEAFQDMLWQRALRHARSGEFAQADRVYQELLETDTSGKIAEVLEDEIGANRERLEALQRAQALCEEGRHGEALELLVASLEGDFDPMAYAMPWNVDSFPSGASVEVEGLGERATPFTLLTTFGESTLLRVELEGFEPREIHVARPSDQYVHLSRVPERAWRGEGRVDALPVHIEDGSTIVVDRGGHMARIAAGGEVLWETNIQTLSGIARSPVFLPEKPGHLLAVTQDGKAWMVRAEDGDLQGPWDLGSPPVAGPYQTQQVVRVRLQNGEVTFWKDRLRPYVPTAQTGATLVDRDEEYRYGSSAGLQVLRRRRDLARELASTWTPWRVVVEDQVYRVENTRREEGSYTVLRAGEWEFLAWEAPRPGLTEGRLWISDESGLRAFVPLER